MIRAPSNLRNWNEFLKFNPFSHCKCSALDLRSLSFPDGFCSLRLQSRKALKLTLACWHADTQSFAGLGTIYVM